MCKPIAQRRINKLNLNFGSVTVFWQVGCENPSKTLQGIKLYDYQELDLLSFHSYSVEFLASSKKQQV